MIVLHRLIASWLGIGYIGKGGGTVAASVAALLLYLLGPVSETYHWMHAALALGTTAIGIWSAGEVEAGWGKDDKKVVIDEVAGMFISMAGIAATLEHILIALVLFRFFDIAKPLGIRRAERLKKGWGVMGDDVLAGIYTNIIMWLITIYA